MSDAQAGPQLSALDWIAFGLAVLGVFFCLQFPFGLAGTYAKMFRDFGGELPVITRLALSVWFPLLLGAVPVLPLVLSLDSKRGLGTQRAMVVVGFFSAMAAVTLLMLAMYAPIQQLAGQIQ